MAGAPARAAPLRASPLRLTALALRAQPLVFRFRALRESLTSEGVGGALTLRAYEAAAEVCAAAGDTGEFLKCQQRLLAQLYPAAAAAAAAGSADVPPTARWAEFAACGALYFGCVGGAHDEVVATLRTLPPHLLRAPPVRCALAALAALARRDGAAFCACATHADATPLMRLLMARKLPAARHAALAATARAYRTLPAAEAARRLRLPCDALGAVLAAAAAAPGAPAQLAVAARAYAAATPPPPELSFVAA